MQLVVKRFEELTTQELYELLKLRVSVFVVEQRCAYQELDGRDQGAYHVYLRDRDGIKAYLRVLDRGAVSDQVSLGRVVALERRRGLGSRVLSAGIAVAKQRLHADRIMIAAQTYAKGFYERAGFRQVSEEFLEDGIPHIKMLLE